SGVYLWTVSVRGEEWPWYVGQTRRGFGQRTAEHLRAFLCGEYPLVDVAALSRGECRMVAGMQGGLWPEALPSFLQNYERLASNISALVGTLGFSFAPLEPEGNLLDRVEGAIGRHFKRHSNRELMTFFYPGLRVPAAIPFDRPVRFLFSSETPVAGM